MRRNRRSFIPRRRSGGSAVRNDARQHSGATQTGVELGSSNLANQRILGARKARARTAVSQPGDPAEREADRFADTVMSPAGEPKQVSISEHLRHVESTTVARKPRSGKQRSQRGDAGATDALRGPGMPLPASVRGEFEPRLGIDLAAVRVHTGSEAAAAARRIDANAYTVGDHIAFAAGRFTPEQDDGRRLLAHELAHVAQHRRDGGAPAAVHRDAANQSTNASQVCEEDGGPQVCEAENEAPTPNDPAHPASLNLTGELDQRIEAFKELVKTTAVHRLISNQRNLSVWATLVETQIHDASLAATGLVQSGGYGAYRDMQDMNSPTLRWLRSEQAVGHYRACTGCHIEKDAKAREADVPHIGREWLSPNQARAGMPTPGFAFSGGDTDARFPFPRQPAQTSAGYAPPPDTAEYMLNTLLPDPDDVPGLMERVRPIFEQLGPDGYAVLPSSMLAELEHGDMATLRQEIIDAISQRKIDFGELIGKIEGGDLGYEHFGPIISNLLPLADEEVRAAIQEEMDSHAFWGKVKAVVVGVLSIAALILTIFPPTSALGIAALGALDVGLGVYGASSGWESYKTGSAYSLGIGADDVLSKDQQQGGTTMVLMGFIGMVAAPLSILGGTLKLGVAATRFGTAAESMSAVLRVGQTIQYGDYAVTLAADGSVTATSISQPDILFILRGNTITQYQSLGPMGMRVITVTEVPAAATDAASGTALLGGGSQPSPMLGPGPAPSLMLGPGPEPPLQLGPGPAPPLQLGPGPAPPLQIGPGPEPPLQLGPGPTPPLQLGPGPAPPFQLGPGPAAPLQLGPGPAPPMQLGPGPPPPLMLGAGNATTYTWDQISRMRQPNLWQERQLYMQQLYGAPGEEFFPVPNTGGRYVDVPAPGGAGKMLAGEVKSYQRWITVDGEATENVVSLSNKIKRQIAKDVWLRNNDAAYDPRWIFTDAPPTEELRQALRDAGIVFIEHIK